MSMSPPSVALRILEALQRVGTETVFGLPGVHNLGFWAQEDRISTSQVVNVRHEQTAGYAADGWSRVSGRLGAAIVTTGPGAANCVAAFGEASRSHSPVLLLASEVSTQLTNAGVRGALHESRDQASIFESLAKQVFTPRSVPEVANALSRAIEVTLSSPRGPVYLDVPSDILTAPGDPIEIRPALVPMIDESALEEAVAVLERSESIVLWVGGGAVEANAGSVVAKLASHLLAPVVTTFAGRGCIPGSHPCAVNLPPHEPEVEDLLRSADALLAIGSDFDAMMTKNQTLRLPSVIVNINCDPDHTSIGSNSVLPVIGDAKLAVEVLVRSLRRRMSGLSEQLEQLHARVWARLRADTRTRSACHFVTAVENVVLGSVTLIADMAIPGYWIGGYCRAQRSRMIQYPVGWGTLGYALPASIGAAHGSDLPVLAICGDGGFMFALGELATIADGDLPITVLIVDDDGYGMLRFDQTARGDQLHGVDLRNPDFLTLARSFGLSSVQVEDVGKPLEFALNQAIESRRPNVIVCKARLFPPRTTSPRWSEP